ILRVCFFFHSAPKPYGFYLCFHVHPYAFFSTTVRQIFPRKFNGWEFEHTKVVIACICICHAAKIYMADFATRRNLNTPSLRPKLISCAIRCQLVKIINLSAAAKIIQIFYSDTHLTH
ncbi:MAG: hypothetical protein ACK55Z_01230, partial [bacterium]